MQFRDQVILVHSQLRDKLLSNIVRAAAETTTTTTNIEEEQTPNNKLSIAKYAMIMYTQKRILKSNCPIN